ncbi:hypothetical protein VULLAG_LOCUS7568 [Vulpes lagopus]
MQKLVQRGGDGLETGLTEWRDAKLALEPKLPVGIPRGDDSASTTCMHQLLQEVAGLSELWGERGHYNECRKPRVPFIRLTITGNQAGHSFSVSGFKLVITLPQHDRCYRYSTHPGWGSPCHLASEESSSKTRF